MVVDTVKDMALDWANENGCFFNFYDLPVWSICLVHMLCRLMSTKAETSSVKQHVRAIVRTRCRASDDETLLHIAIHNCILACL